MILEIPLLSDLTMAKSSFGCSHNIHHLLSKIVAVLVPHFTGLDYHEEEATNMTNDPSFSRQNNPSFSQSNFPWGPIICPEATDLEELTLRTELPSPSDLFFTDGSDEGGRVPPVMLVGLEQDYDVHWFIYL